jgi:hypothetical protein
MRLPGPKNPINWQNFHRVAKLGLAAIRRDKIVMGDVEFEKVTTPEPDQQTILDYLKVRL